MAIYDERESKDWSADVDRADIEALDGAALRGLYRAVTSAPYSDDPAEMREALAQYKRDGGSLDDLR